MEVAQLRREDARWKMLQIVDAGRPIGVNEGIVRRVLMDLKLPMQEAELRREMTYLRDLGLIEIGESDDELFAKATSQGVAVVEYTAAAPAGVARPVKGAI